MISRIIEVEVRVISQSQRLRLITLTEKKSEKQAIGKKVANCLFILILDVISFSFFIPSLKTNLQFYYIEIGVLIDVLPSQFHTHNRLFQRTFLALMFFRYF